MSFLFTSLSVFFLIVCCNRVNSIGLKQSVCQARAFRNAQLLSDLIDHIVSPLALALVATKCGEHF